MAPDLDFSSFTLRNGIRVVHKRMPRVALHCGLVINAGSRDELENEQGLAHFIEHSIFKGTKKRKAFHVLSLLDKVGAEINAYTTKEETWIYASVLTDHFERAIDLISDITFQSTFPDKEIAKEKDVILDEINSYLDSPSEIIFDDFEEQVYAGHAIGRNILGTEESVSGFTRENIQEMMGRHYRTDQMVFSVVGDIDTRKVKRLAEKYLEPHTTPASKRTRKAFATYKPQNIEENRETFQIHYLLGGLGYDIYHEQKTALILLNNYLGGPAMNSRLNMGIREKHGIAYNIESNYQAYSDTGIFQIYLGTDEKYFEKSKKLVNKELQNLCGKKLSTTQLHMAKQQLIGQIALAQDSGSGNMMALGKSVLLYDKIDSLEEVIAKVNAVTAEDLLAVANEILDPKALGSLTFR